MRQFTDATRLLFHTTWRPDSRPFCHCRSVAYSYASKAGVPRSDVTFVQAIAPKGEAVVRSFLFVPFGLSPELLLAGSVIFHHGQLMHGSDKNRRVDVWRRSMGVHLVPAGERCRTVRSVGNRGGAPHSKCVHRRADTRHGVNDGYIYGR
jgi:ectoine hydroxylase-related dioxygenase (phytanoyl-CoA dioxygenase family)